MLTAVADTAVLTWNLAVTVAIGFAVGFRLHGSVAAGLAALGLCVLFGFAFIWLFVTIGLFAGNAQAAQGMSLLVFPLTFVSSAYVPVDSMPGWLQAFADHQPITAMVDAVRDLCLGQPAGSEVVVALVGVPCSSPPSSPCRWRASGARCPVVWRQGRPIARQLSAVSSSAGKKASTPELLGRDIDRRSDGRHDREEPEIRSVEPEVDVDDRTGRHDGPRRRGQGPDVRQDRSSWTSSAVARSSTPPTASRRARSSNAGATSSQFAMWIGRDRVRGSGAARCRRPGPVEERTSARRGAGLHRWFARGSIHDP